MFGVGEFEQFDGRRLIPVSYTTKLPCHDRGRGFESRRPPVLSNLRLSQFICTPLGYNRQPFACTPKVIGMVYDAVDGSH